MIRQKGVFILAIIFLSLGLSIGYNTPSFELKGSPRNVDQNDIKTSKNFVSMALDQVLVIQKVSL